jgi:hypothetical protein
LGGSLYIIKRNTEALLVGSKYIGLDVNADKTKHMIMSADQNSERRHNINIDNRTFGREEELQY